MLTRVATFSTSSLILSAALNTQAKLATQQLEEASGKVSTDYGGLGSKAGQVVSLQVAVSRSAAYADAATEASGRATVMSDALTSMSNVLTQFRTALTQASDAAGDTSLLPDQAKSMLDEFTNQLNTQYQGRYLFSGSATQDAPVDSSALSTGIDMTTADTSYYKGNSDIMSVRVSADQTVGYGVLASNPAFEQTIRVLNAFANMSSTDVTAASLTDASTQVDTALDGVLAVQGQLAVQSGTLDRAANDQQSFQDYAGSLVSNLSDVDVASVTAQMSAYETQLQASYAAISKISSLRLMDYLK